MAAGDWGWFLPDSVTGAPVDYKADDAQRTNPLSREWSDTACGYRRGE